MSNPPGTSAEAIRAHYDVSRAFYQLWLDPTMTYSCAKWDGVDTLEEAQIAKLEHHVAAAHAAGVRRVLEVGCGWGGLLERLVTLHGVEHAVGLTLSDDQHAHAESLGLAGVDVRVQSWTDHTADEPYDAIIAIGPLEHFARVDDTPAQKIAAYRAFFEKMHGLLAPGGRLSMQTIIYLTLETLDPFIQEKIWPESDLPRLQEILAATDRLFELEASWTGREDYARTCREWARRLQANQAEAISLVGEETVHDWLRYLKMSARAFDVSALGLWRYQLKRIP